MMNDRERIKKLEILLDQEPDERLHKAMKGDTKLKKEQAKVWSKIIGDELDEDYLRGVMRKGKKSVKKVKRCGCKKN